MLKPQVVNTKQIGSDLPINERAEAACNVAKRLETAGDYEVAYEALSEFWPDANATPNLADLDESIAAQLLLRAGALPAQGTAVDRNKPWDKRPGRLKRLLLKMEFS